MEDAIKVFKMRKDRLEIRNEFIEKEDKPYRKETNESLNFTTDYVNWLEEELVKSNSVLGDVSDQRELLCAFFKFFRDNGEANIGMTIEQFVDAFLAQNNR